MRSSAFRPVNCELFTFVGAEEESGRQFRAVEIVAHFRRGLVFGETEGPVIGEAFAGPMEHAAGRGVTGSAGEDMKVDSGLVRQRYRRNERRPASFFRANFDYVSFGWRRLLVNGEMERFVSGLIYVVIAILVQSHFLTMFLVCLISIVIVPEREDQVLCCRFNFSFLAAALAWYLKCRYIIRLSMAA